MISSISSLGAKVSQYNKEFTKDYTGYLSRFEKSADIEYAKTMFELMQGRPLKIKNNLAFHMLTETTSQSEVCEETVDFLMGCQQARGVNLLAKIYQLGLSSVWGPKTTDLLRELGYVMNFDTEIPSLLIESTFGTDGYEPGQ